MNRGFNLEILNSKFENNTSKGKGSILMSGIKSSINVSSSMFEGNTANEGGVFFIDESVIFTSQNCKFIQNSAIRGGVMYSINLVDGTVLFKESTFIEN